MRVADRLLRESSYNRRNVSKQDLDYGGFYHIQYQDSTNDKRSGRYFIFVIQPEVGGKTHCLDLDLVEEGAFDAFFRRIRIENEEVREIRKAQGKGYVKQNIRIGNRFYDNFIKGNKDLLRHWPYKTLEFDKIHNVRYIAYDL